MDKKQIVELQRNLLESATGPGIQRRFEEFAALQNVNKPGDGVVMNPDWQDDVMRGAPVPQPQPRPQKQVGTVCD